MTTRLIVERKWYVLQQSYAVAGTLLSPMAQLLCQLTPGAYNLSQVDDVLMLQRAEQFDLANGCDGKALLLVVHPYHLERHLVSLLVSTFVNFAVCALTDLVGICSL